jgi:hypothetical protein
MTSKVFPVPPDALGNALGALARWKAQYPREYGWVAEGAPNVTPEEHYRRFGEAYMSPRSRRSTK